MNIFWFIIFYPFKFLPFQMIPCVGHGLGRIYFFLDKKHRLEIMQRAKNSIEENYPGSIKKMVLDFYRQLGVFALELLKFPTLNKKSIRKIVTDLKSKEFNQLLEEGKGAILVTGHFANWEYAGLAFASEGYPVNTVAKPLKQKSLDAFFVRCREKTGQKIVYQDQALKFLLRALKNKEFAILLMDYDTHPDKGGIFVPFFHKPVSTLPTPAFLLNKTKAPIVVTRLKRFPDQHYEVVIGDIIRAEEYADDPDFAYKITARIQKSFERFILEDPEQWLWLQRRWRFDPNDFQIEN